MASPRPVDLRRFALDLTPLRASPAFRALFGARLASLLVYGVQGVSTNLQLYELTGSAVAVGALSLAMAGPMALSLAYGGVLADRSDRRVLILGARSAYLLAILLLLANALRPEPDAWPIYAAAVIGGISGGVSLPALAATVTTLVGRENLPAAAALGSVATQAGAIGGPALAGLLVGRVGYAACYGVVLLGAGLTVALLTRLPPLPRGSAGAADRRVGAELREGIAFALGTPLILALLLADTAATLLATPFATLPKFGADELRADAWTIGLLFSASAAGSLAAALFSGWLRTLARPGRALLACVLGCGLAVAGLGLAPNAWLAAACLALLGLADTWSEIIRGFLLQQHTPDRILGRVSSLWLLQATTTPALGNLLIGGLAEQLTSRAAFLMGGLGCVAAASLLTATLPALARVGGAGRS